ncbi:DUF2235 domain-containing protein [Nocardia cerradoensis]|uniref:DUF2235 domain-containing protein n=1 Tax=Nocardia cerradoensis TaxID=85688 RepID=UPI00031E4740|nr:DUF2235 domain-containing protein [Nocardia cerradoensis]NKY44120.1 DUF2235 domain-containing protein [Nocardia cerradoensis]
MKRLVVCCDGTWGSESNPTVSNVVKIAESVRSSAVSDAGDHVGQRVFYVDGPGSRGYLADKLLGGAFGLGLDANLSTMYWQLALNWEPGDEIYVFGFSRGAYTARSLVGMVNRLGLLTADAMIERAYPEALAIYRQRKVDPDGPDRPEWIEFRERHCVYPVPIHFVGVFDTVGALGVPLLTSWRYRFHDVRLSRNVRYARQALAIDERRRMYAPCLWEVTDDPEGGPTGADRVQQVWFEGVHTDIGGGYADSRLSDITLRWMVDQARRAGLSFDDERIEQLLNGRTPVQPAAAPDSTVAAPDSTVAVPESTVAVPDSAVAVEDSTTKSPPRAHDSLTLFYRVLNRVGWALHPRNPRFYADSWRRLSAPGDRLVYLADCAAPCATYRPPNVVRWAEELAGPLPTLPVGKHDEGADRRHPAAEQHVPGGEHPAGSGSVAGTAA